MTPALIGRLMDGHFNLYMSLRPIPVLAATSNPFGLEYHNLILKRDGIEPDWLALLQKHSNRFVMGGDTFFLSSSVETETAAVTTLSRGNQPRLKSAVSPCRDCQPIWQERSGSQTHNTSIRQGHTDHRRGRPVTGCLLDKHNNLQESALSAPPECGFQHRSFNHSDTLPAGLVRSEHGDNCTPRRS